MGCEEESLVEDIQVCFFFLLPLLAFHCTSTRSLWNSYSRDFTTCQQLWKKVGAENIWNYDLNKNVRLYEFSFIIPSLTSLTNKCKNPHGHGVCLPLRSPKDCLCTEPFSSAVDTSKSCPCSPKPLILPLPLLLPCVTTSICKAHLLN